MSFLISQNNNTLYYDDPPPPITLPSPTTGIIKTQPIPTNIPRSTTSTMTPLSTSTMTPLSTSTVTPLSTSTPPKQTVEQMIEAFKTATGKQICACENIFHAFLRDKRTPNPVSDIDKKCFELAKQIKAATTTPQQICTYRDNIFHPTCRGPKLNGGRCT